MSERGLNQVVGLALVDKRFRRKLLSDPAGASTRFDLTPQERQVLRDIRVNSLEQLAQELHSWLESNAAGNGHRSLDEISKRLEVGKE